MAKCCKLCSFATLPNPTPLPYTTPMTLEGDESVLSVLKDHKRARDAGQAPNTTRLLLVVDGGLMKGAYATGAGLALEALGYTDVFDTVVGISSGAPSAAYFVAGEVWKGSSLLSLGQPC